jgi:hypothetical protein
MDGNGRAAERHETLSLAQEITCLRQMMESVCARAKQSMAVAAAQDADPPPYSVGPAEVFRSLGACVRGGKEVKKRIAGVLQLLEDIQCRDAEHFAQCAATLQAMMNQLSNKQ